ncbi:hypothetical protein LPY66_18910 [Dehalobacter sp. DCM]|uniref:hypothetical protein n=1 Tax=Dehalobacter sp. DCM TaxID=2907827 RepID=UPI0030816BE0|nr:hypothetical protein LPY66_18910 [Dehalobacter sp. DCM]
MGTSILKGVTIGLLVTVLTLVTVLVCNLIGVENSIIAYVVDFGLLLSCLAAGFRASQVSERILAAGLASGGYAIVGIGLLALYFPIDSLGALKTISEGIGLGLLAGILGAGVLNPKPQDYERPGVYPASRPESHIYSKRESVQPNHADSELVRAKIYDLCNKKSELTEEEEAFDWWEINRKSQLRGK